MYPTDAPFLSDPTHAPAHAPAHDAAPDRGAAPQPAAPEGTAPSEAWVGREAELDALHGLLQRGMAQVRGMVGVGKTALAAAYARRFAAAYPGGIFFLDAAAGGLDPQLEALSGPLGCAAPSGPDRAAAVRGLLAARAARYLWVVDNLPLDAISGEGGAAAGAAMAATWRAPGPAGATLFTTRGRGLDGLGPAVDLEPLPMAEALRLLRGPTPLTPAEEADAESLLVMVGRLPLAVALLRGLCLADRAGGDGQPFDTWVRQLQHEEWRARKPGWPEAAVWVGDQPRVGSPPALLERLRGALADLSPTAWALLALTDALADPPVPRSALRSAWAAAEGLLPADAEALLGAAFAELQARSLATSTEGGLQVHPLVRRAALLENPEPTRAAGLRAALPGALLTALGDVEDARSHGASAGVAAHADSVATHDLHPTDVALIMAMFHRERAANQDVEALRRAKQDHAEAAQALGPEHPEALRALRRLAEALDAGHAPEAARRAYAEAHAAQARLLGPEHPDTLQTLDRFAESLRTNDKHNAATLPLFELAHAARVRALGPEHPDTLEALHQLAATHLAQSDSTGARALFQQALAARSRLLGADHDDTLRTQAALAALYLGTREREAFLQANGAIQRARAHEPDHPDVLECLRRQTHLHLVEVDEAAYEQAVAALHDALVRALGVEHPETIRSLLSVAHAHARRRDWSGALALFSNAHAALVRRLGPEHPEALVVLAKLATTLHDQGAHSAARARTTEYIERTARLLGPESIHTAWARGALAELLFEADAHEDARALYSAAFATYRRRLGPSHPDSQRLRFKLMLTHRALGETDAMQAHIEALLPLRDLTLAPGARQAPIQAWLRAQVPAA
jgi:hypothetical protein